MTGGLLRLEEAADVLGVSVRTVKRRIQAGQLAVFVDGGVRRVRTVDLERYIAEHVRVQSQASAQLRTPGRTVGAGSRLWD